MMSNIIEEMFIREAGYNPKSKLKSLDRIIEFFHENKINISSKEIFFYNDSLQMDIDKFIEIENSKILREKYPQYYI